MLGEAEMVTVVGATVAATVTVEAATERVAEGGVAVEREKVEAGMAMEEAEMVRVAGATVAATVTAEAATETAVEGGVAVEMEKVEAESVAAVEGGVAVAMEKVEAESVAVMAMECTRSSTCPSCHLARSRRSSGSRRWGTDAARLHHSPGCNGGLCGG